MSQLNGQQPDRPDHALYRYCKVMRVPKLGAAPAVITVLEGLVLTLLIAALGESPLTAVIIGASVSALLRRSPLRTTSSGLGDIFCLSKTGLC